jgi:hypothetical protein
MSRGSVDRSKRGQRDARLVASNPSLPAEGAPAIPQELVDLLDPATVVAWTAIEPLLPDGLYLVGEGALAAHLHHRQTEDLEFFFHGDVDLAALAETLSGRDNCMIDYEGPGTLRIRVGTTKIEFFNADHVKPQRQLQEPVSVAGLRVAGLRDLMAIKLKMVRERGELRDYYDLMMLDTHGGISIELGLRYLMQRYGVRPENDLIQGAIFSLGNLHDLQEDAQVPMSKADLEAWWKARQLRLIRNLESHGL